MLQLGLHLYGCGVLRENSMYVMPLMPIIMLYLAVCSYSCTHYGRPTVWCHGCHLKYCCGRHDGGYYQPDRYPLGVWHDDVWCMCHMAAGSCACHSFLAA